MKTIMFLALTCVLFIVHCSGTKENTLSLAGEWSFKMDPQDSGIGEKWYNSVLPDRIALPGSMTENGLGYEVTKDTQWTGEIVDQSYYTDKRYAPYRQPGNIKMPFWLNPVKYYVGPAWYQKEITIPSQWENKQLVLSLERPHWQTAVWLNGNLLGTQNSLSTAHQFELGALTPGQYRLTIRVDNSIKDVNVGPNSHSISDHTQGNWNGITGRIEIRAYDAVRIDDMQLFPDVKTGVVRTTIAVRNLSGQSGTGFLTLEALCDDQHFPAQRIPFDYTGPKEMVTIDYAMGADVRLWNEFSPHLYKMQASLETKKYRDRKQVTFGMREIASAGTNFTLNGKKIFLRGTLECCVFPLTGYPPTTIKEWLRILKKAKSYGLNHLRFHSWCPPEAAFTAADQMGFIYYVECASWANSGSALGDGKPVDEYIYAEGDRILKAYGSHPSFCLMSYGNEPAGVNSSDYLAKLVNYWRQKDTRRLYTSGAGWPILPENQWHSTPAPRIHGWGAGLDDRLNRLAPATTADYADFITQYNVPVVSHEIGQWCVFPNFIEIGKYTGVVRAKNFEIFQDFLTESHMLDQAEDFLQASGKLQTLCYKEEIESALRTAGMGGFELLDLHDFPGQGSALVGVLDAFWDDKGYVTAAEFRRFCCETVPLARLEKRIFTPHDIFAADVEVAHYGPAVLKNMQPAWKIIRNNGSILAAGVLDHRDIQIGNGIKLGRVILPMTFVSPAQKLTLVVELTGTEYQNSWDFWVYPMTVDVKQPDGLIICQDLDESILIKLQSGASVLYMPRLENVKSDIIMGFTPIFWNTAWTNRQAPHTLGLLCKPDHPALSLFPTEFHSNWQWWDLVTHARPMIMDNLPPDLRPIVQVIDDWFTDHRLGLLFEARVGSGKIVVCSMDLTSQIEQRPVARQMLYSLYQYMGSDRFAPQIQLDAKVLKAKNW
jgi:hypothetical protein